MSSNVRPRVVAQGLSFVVDGDRPPLFEDLTLTLGEERVALVGPNGAGKTTLVRLLLGELSPTRGSVVREGRIAYLPQDPAPLIGGDVADALGVGPPLRALARVLSGDGDEDDLLVIGDRWDLEEEARRALTRLSLEHLPLDRPVSTLSGGERTRVAIAGCLLEAPCLLLLDEPTNHLDRNAREAIYRLVEEHPAALYVSHDRELLARVDRIVELSPLGPRFYGGGFSLYQEQREAEAEAARARVEHAEKELSRARREAQQARERQEKRTARGKRKGAEGGVPKILLGCMKQRAEGTTARLAVTGERRVEDAAASLSRARAQVARAEALAFDLEPTSVPAGKIVLFAEGLSFAPERAAPILEDVTLQVTGPERVAITGENGAGKSTLLQLLAGRLAPTAGGLRVGVEETAFLDQDSGLEGTRAAASGPAGTHVEVRRDAGSLVGCTVIEALGRARPDLPEGKRKERLAPFLFRGDDVHKRVQSLSGGERLRLALCLALSTDPPPRLLLLDEPTNHLDLSSTERLEEVLRAYRGALVVVSHDERFLERVGVERRLHLEKGRLLA